MRLGIFGGSFDPPHTGHLVVAQDAMDALSLDRMLIVPAAHQPLKHDQFASAEHRLAMVQRCFTDIAGMTVDPIEMQRGGLSFMVDTVASVRQRYPSVDLHLLIGDDVARTLPLWREPQRLLSMVHLVVLTRVTESEPTESPAEKRDGLGGSLLGFPVQRLATRRVDVSSTEVRARVRSGRSIRGFVTDAVADYIASAGLYLRDPVAEDVSARA